MADAATVSTVIINQIVLVPLRISIERGSRLL
jgi:hypothetical protein